MSWENWFPIFSISHKGFLLPEKIDCFTSFLSSTVKYNGSNFMFSRLILSAAYCNKFSRGKGYDQRLGLYVEG